MAYILLIGDTHIPDRSDAVPDKLLEVIEEGKPWDIVVFTGDFTGKSVLDWVESLGHAVYYVRGNMDFLPLPKTMEFTVEGIRFGVHHGDGVYPRGNKRDLTRIAVNMGVQVLLTGHTHSPFIKNGLTPEILLINPGSLTGVWGGGGGSMKSSMMVLTVGEGAIRIIHYELSSDWRRLSRSEKKAVYSSGKWVL